jgi:septal ring factor EnvC (AmiA/AmiB activator)
VLAAHRKQLESQMADLQANLDEIKTHEKEARALLAKADQVPAPKPKKAAKAEQAAPSTYAPRPSTQSTGDPP